MPKPIDWIHFAKVVVRMHEAQLGPDFHPPNMGPCSEKSATAIKNLRAPFLKQKNPPMISYLHEVSKAVKTHKTGCCGELAMSAFNLVRIVEPSAQIFQVPGSDDLHAFLIMGALDSYYDDISIENIASDWPDAIIVDYWASCHINTLPGAHGRGIFKVGEYRKKTEAALSLGSYDLSKCKIFSTTGKRDTPGFAAVNIDRIRLKS